MLVVNRNKSYQNEIVDFLSCRTITYVICSDYLYVSFITCNIVDKLVDTNVNIFWQGKI